MNLTRTIFKLFQTKRTTYCTERQLLKRISALRFIYFSDQNQHAIPLFSDAGVLPLQFSYYEITADLVFAIRHRNTPRYSRDLFRDL